VGEVSGQDRAGRDGHRVGHAAGQHDPAGFDGQAAPAQVVGGQGERLGRVALYGGLEVIDSRYRDFRFALPDVVADNASSGCFVTGPVAASPAALDLSLEACLLELNGQVVDSATGAAVQGHPAEALALAANDLGRRGLAIEPGWIVLTGGMTDAVAVPAGAVLAAHFTHLGSLFLP
jgi:2-oxo-3-hexenedioate decarboxylase